MKILGSTQYVNLEKQKESWYQLSVISQWDFSSKSICRRRTNCGSLISYCLNFCTVTSSNTYRQIAVLELTEEMEEILIRDGYQIN